MPAIPDALIPNMADLVAAGKVPVVTRLITNLEITKAADPEVILILKLRLAVLTNDSEQGLALLDTLISKHAYLSEYALKAKIRLYLDRGELQKALDTFSRYSGSRLSMDEARLLIDIADIARMAERYQTAEKQYLRVLTVARRGETADRARFGLVKSRLALKQDEQALRNLRYMQRNFREPAYLVEARALETRYHEERGALRPAYSEAQYREMSERLIDRAAYNQALSLLAEWQQRYPKSASSDRIDYLRLRILVNQRENDAAYQTADTFLKTYGKSSLRHSVSFQKLILLQRMGDTARLRQQALKYWQGEYGGSSGRRRSAAMLLAAYLVSSGNASEGLSLYRDIYRSGVNRSLQNEILWRVGVGALRDNQNERALNNLQARMRRRPRGVDRLSTYYWIAEAEQRLGRPRNAVINLLQILKDEPYSYYGFLARTQLVRLTPQVDGEWLMQVRRKYAGTTKDFPDLSLSKTVLASRQYKALSTILRSGWTEYVEDAANALRSAYNGDRGVAFLAARAYARAGQTWKSVQTTQTFFQSYIDGNTKKLPDHILRLAYPRPFMSIINQAAESQKLDALFMTSVMRQESRFNPVATSWVGARGLFQFMDYTAAMLGPEIGLHDLQPDDLYDPVINASLAAYYQRNLFELFDRRIPPIVASYNAGETRALAWWKAALKEEIGEDLFIDTIPYQETRSFVRAVLTNYFMYMRIYQD